MHDVPRSVPYEVRRVLAEQAERAAVTARAVPPPTPAMRGATHILVLVDEMPSSPLGWVSGAVSSGPALTHDGEDARHAATRKPPADPRLRGAAFGARGRR